MKSAARPSRLRRTVAALVFVAATLTPAVVVFTAVPPASAGAHCSDPSGC